jgi:hypothetical protein
VKVIVTLEVEVDPETWDRNYGTGTSPADVRADVKAHIASSTGEHFARALGVVEDVRGRA